MGLLPFVRGVASADAIAEIATGALMYWWLWGPLIATTFFVSFYARLCNKKCQVKIETKQQNNAKRNEKKPQLGLRKVYVGPEPSVELAPALC